MNHTIRATDGTIIEVEDYSRGKAIKAMCGECMGWDCNPKKECTSPLCPLYPFRAGSRIASHTAQAAAKVRSVAQKGDKTLQNRITEQRG